MGQLHDAFAALARPAGPGRPVRSQSQKLHAKIVWSALAQAEGGEDCLWRRYVAHGTAEDELLTLRPDEIRLYREGSRSLSGRRMALLVGRHPQLGPITEWPLHLLDSDATAVRALQRSLRSYVVAGFPDQRLVFPGDEVEPRAANRFAVSYGDLERLYERGDVYGFLAIAAAYRAFHLERAIDSQWYAGRYLIRALPGFCREACVRPHALEAITLTKALLTLLPDTSFRVEVDDAVLWEQISGAFHPSRQLRLDAAKEGRTLEVPDEPIVSYRYQRCGPSQVPIPLAST